MPVTTIDRDAALIAIDMQNGILGKAEPAEADRIVARTGDLARAFRSRGLPVVWVTVTGRPKGRNQMPKPGEPPADYAVLDPRLPVADGDAQVTKQALSAFTSAELTDLLRQRGVTNVVITGIATGMGVESTARDAYDAGYNVTIATDAVTDAIPARGRGSIENAMPGFAELGTTAEIIAALGDA